MVKYLFFVVLCLSTISCSKMIYDNNPPLRYLSEFTLCYGENSINEHFLLRHNGFYHQDGILRFYSFKNSDWEVSELSYSANFIFFKDGIFLFGVTDRDEYRALSGLNDLDLYFQELTQSTEKTKRFLNSGYWGLYSVSNDTIRTQYINHPSWNMPWNATELIFVFDDHGKLNSIQTRALGITNTNIIPSRTELIRHPAEYIPLETLPSSDAWLKREKWFWCDEDEWRTYMEQNGYKIRRRDRAIR
jgi:hypothetical protein